MSTKIAYGIFDDDDVVLHAIPKLQEKKFKVVDVISPFPIHGLDHALGLKRTRISMTACHRYQPCIVDDVVYEYMGLANGYRW